MKKFLQKLIHLIKAYNHGNSIIIVKQNGTLSKNPLYIKNIDIKIVGKHNQLKIHEPINIGSRRLKIECQNVKVVIGKNARILDLCIRNISGPSANMVAIGDNFSVNKALFQLDGSNKTITIGNDCLFSWDIEISTTDQHKIIDLTTKEQINNHSDVKIGNHCWICKKATILKGVDIPDGSVIGTNSIVTKSFTKRNTIIAGNPAKIVKENIDWAD